MADEPIEDEGVPDPPPAGREPSNLAPSSSVDSPILSESVNRAEHLRWCKDRALGYVDRGEFSAAVASMMSDLRKHPDTAASAIPEIGIIGILVASSPRATRHWIEGFN